MIFRAANPEDCPRLAELNRQLIQDEDHRNPMDLSQLEERMRGWLATAEYRAFVGEESGEIIVYALFREHAADIYLRQLFVVRDRRRQGIGRQMIEFLRAEIWPANKRLTVEVLVSNTPALAFWRAVGYRDYSLLLEILP